MDANKNARVIIPLAIGAWLIGGALAALDPPGFVLVLFGVLFVAIVTLAVFYLMAEQGWSTLAKRYRAWSRYDGRWQPCPAAQMALVSVDHPEFNRRRLRLVSTLQVAPSPDALHLSMLFGRIPVLGRRFFPDVAIPWAEVASARTFEAPGWFQPLSQPGALLQVGYDPNYRGAFAELVVGEPPVYVQLPVAILGEAASRLGLTPAM
jgi:hypothetical protein